MPRFARLEAPGAVHHLVSRFVNEEFRIVGPRERQQYLHRVPPSLTRSDWGPLAYALMSSHTHWGCVAGLLPSASFIKPLHAGYAGWLNDSQGRYGPVFADRHRSIVCDEKHAAYLIAYIHNNPVRAGCVRDPADSDWTSHRAFIGLAAAPPWLNVERGLALCGFDSSPSGRLAFHDFVRSRSHEPRSDVLSGGGLAKQRARIRELITPAAECSWPSVGTGGHCRVDVVAPVLQARRLSWIGEAQVVVRHVANRLGVDENWLRHARRHDAAAARRLILHLWTCHLGRRQSEIRTLLGMSSSAASQLLRREAGPWAAIDSTCALLAAELGVKQ